MGVFQHSNTPLIQRGKTKGDNKMKAKQSLILALAVLSATCLVTTVWAKRQKYNMTTNIPASIITPDTRNLIPF
jgi:hypothetical protein